MKKLLFLSVSIFTLLFLAGCGSNEEAKTIVEDNGSFQELKVLSNKTYNLKTTDGKTITLNVENNTLTSKQLKGKMVLINFWATWCPPCIEEIPNFNKIYEKYKDKIVIIGVLFEKDKDPNELKAFMEKYKMKFPVTVGDENFRMAKAFDDVQKVPESTLFDANGKFVEKYIGAIGVKALEKQIKK
jgi:thiol-disulfide isomerase/thioredoxin